MTAPARVSHALQQISLLTQEMLKRSQADALQIDPTRSRV